MEMIFKVSESIEQILNSIYNGVSYQSVLKEEKSPGGWDIVLLKDRDFDCEAIAWINPSKDTIEIETFWSKFKYTIYERRGLVSVKYEGAYHGLLAQNLLPKLTPIELENEMVTTSLKGGKLTYKEYSVLQKKFKEFKANN